ncbi:hypothetical protein BGZ46_004913, partial [Entomortierella lignicola]
MTSEKVRLFCILDGDSTAFPVKVATDETVGELKKAIKGEKPNDLQDVDADKLILFHVSVADEGKPVHLENVESKTPLIKSTNEISEVFGTLPAKKTIHVNRRRHQARQRTLLKSNRAFSCPRLDSPTAIFLTEYVKGAKELPLTTECIKGLQRARRRGKTTAPESRPNFLFLNLPTPSTSNISERFQSNVILQELKKTEAQDVPVFGVSGCGKTRSVMEMLCLQWGFYFNASDKDLGSDDLSILAEFINKKTSEKQDPKDNTTFAKNMTDIVRNEFMSLRNRLAALAYPNFSSGTKLRLVVDEAQILGDRGNDLFESSSIESELRPMLSPILHGFLTPGDRKELTIIYCGTELSIRTLHWAQSSGDGVKEEGSMTSP